MRKLLILATAHALACYNAAADPQITGTPAELRQHLAALPGQVTLTGSSERRVEADRAVMQLSLVSASRQLTAALTQNAQIQTEILNSLKSGGIPADRVHTSQFGATPVNSFFHDKVKEYQVRSTIRVQARTGKEIAAIAGVVDSRSEISLSSLTFEVTDEDELKAELLKEAFQQVEKRRKLYETALGIRLRVRSVASSAPLGCEQVGIHPGSGAPSQVGAYLSSVGAGFGKAAEPMEALAVSQFEERLYRAEVSVVFDLLPNGGDAP